MTRETSIRRLPDGYVEIAFLPGDKYYALWDHEREGYVVYAPDPRNLRLGTQPPGGALP